jgi:uncharacterized protein (DUF433 family)
MQRILKHEATSFLRFRSNYRILPSMSLALEQPQPLPLETDRDGVIRVRGTRITLDTVVEAFRRGATAEEMAQQYPTLALADVYSVLGYFLRHEEEVSAYLASRASARDTVRRDNERRFDPQGVRDRLAARRPAGNGSR